MSESVVQASEKKPNDEEKALHGENVSSTEKQVVCVLDVVKQFTVTMWSAKSHHSQLAWTILLWINRQLAFDMRAKTKYILVLLPSICSSEVNNVSLFSFFVHSLMLKYIPCDSKRKIAVVVVEEDNMTYWSEHHVVMQCSRPGYPVLHILCIWNQSSQYKIYLVE